METDKCFPCSDLAMPCCFSYPALVPLWVLCYWTYCLLLLRLDFCSTKSWFSLTKKSVLKKHPTNYCCSLFTVFYGCGLRLPKKNFQKQYFYACIWWTLHGLWAVLHKWAESIRMNCGIIYQQNPVLSAGKSIPVQLQLEEVLSEV